MNRRDQEETSTEKLRLSPAQAGRVKVKFLWRISLIISIILSVVGTIVLNLLLNG